MCIAPLKKNKIKIINFILFFEKYSKMKTLYVLLLFLSFFSFCENQMTTGHYSLQPKHEPINSTTTSFTDPPTSSKTEISESEENDYLVYEITTPSLTKLYNIDDFKIDVDEKSIIITGKVG